MEREEGNNRHDKLAVSLLKDATVIDHVPQRFRWCFGTSSGTEGPSLVKLLVEESMVLDMYYLTRLLSTFIKCMHLTHDG